jgi:hypothetical protein
MAVFCSSQNRKPQSHSGYKALKSQKVNGTMPDTCASFRFYDSCNSPSQMRQTLLGNGSGILQLLSKDSVAVTLLLQQICTQQLKSSWKRCFLCGPWRDCKTRTSCHYEITHYQKKTKPNSVARVRERENYTDRATSAFKRS